MCKVAKRSTQDILAHSPEILDELCHLQAYGPVKKECSDCGVQRRRSVCNWHRRGHTAIARCTTVAPAMCLIDCQLVPHIPSATNLSGPNSCRRRDPSRHSLKSKHIGSGREAVTASAPAGASVTGTGGRRTLPEDATDDAFTAGMGVTLPEATTDDAFSAGLSAAADGMSPCIPACRMPGIICCGIMPGI